MPRPTVAGGVIMRVDIESLLRFLLVVSLAVVSPAAPVWAAGNQQPGSQATPEDAALPFAMDVSGVTQPSPLRVVGIWPSYGAVNVSTAGAPTFRFSEPVDNSAAVEAAIHFEPAMTGRFNWLAPDRVRFVPEANLPSETEFSMSIRHDLIEVRGESGGLMTESFQTSFTTGRHKVIDVSLREQRLTLYEDEEPVWSALVATGVRGAETPLGAYRVEYKIPVTRFRGVNPNGSRYDIPNVHWVLAFLGDYTIHGAYWRSTFGRPASNGCISLTDANAKHVFDWADEGTAIVVRA
ncbi:MAG: L,D-transpeptidase [Chloroflexi bacterium]|nr:L,D-transpeptidase [Chloroflexota bacterium]